MSLAAQDTVLVTGGAGFIGSAVVHHLMRERACRVVVVDALTYAGARHSLSAFEDDPRFAFIKADIADAAAMEDVFNTKRPSKILHLAAESHVDRSIDGPADFVRTNVHGTFTLLEAARRLYGDLDEKARARFRFVHVSTDEVFGALSLSDPPFHEATPYDPRSPYSASKAASDHLARAWGHTYGLPVIVTNCTNNYGPRQFPEKLIPLMILKARAGEPLPVYGRGDNVRDWLHVDDHARGLVLAAERGAPGDTFCFGGAAERTNLEVVEALCDAVDKVVGPRNAGPRRDLITFVTDRPGHDFRYAMAIDHARAALGWSPSHGFEEGLEATARWYVEHEDWWRPLLDRPGVGERLGLAAASRR